MYVFLIPLVITLLISLKRNIWNKALSLSSLGIKVGVLIALVAYEKRLEYLLDVSVLYIMASGAGIMLLLHLILRSDLE